MRTRIVIAALVVAGSVVVAVPAAHAATTVTTVLTDVGALYPSAVAHLDGPGQIVWNNTQIVDQSADGDCVPLATGTTGPHRNPVQIGYTCTGPVDLYLTLQTARFACTGDPGVWQATSALTLKLDGVTVVDETYGIRDGECWATPAAPATVTWTPGVLTFDNTGQPLRQSAGTTFTVNDAAWNYSAHTFTTPPNIACGRHLVLQSTTRWIKRWVERGFTCSGAVTAGMVDTIVVS